MKRKTAMDRTALETLRKEMLTHTDKAVAEVQDMSRNKHLAGYSQKAMNALTYALKIQQRNVLPIAILAQSQMGKSTTAAAVADGREIVPCGRGGGGIRTSSVPVTLYYDPQKTKVEIQLYSKEELAAQVVETADPFLPSGRETGYDLDNEADRRLLHQAVEQEIRVYQTTADYDHGRLSLLRRAILIMALYGSAAHRDLQKERFDTVEKIQPFVAFPEDLEVRWAQLKTRGFSVIHDLDMMAQPLFGQVENLHVFIREIRIPTQSLFMRDTGTSFTDAPGTLMSVEDTKRATNAAAEAAVVLVLLPEGQLTQPDKDLLEALRKSGMTKKVVFAVNFHQSIKTPRARNNEQSQLASLAQAGYSLPQHQSLLYYNAFLAARAAQGRLLMSKQMDPITARGILEDARVQGMDPKDVKEAWIHTVTAQLFALGMMAEAAEVTKNGLCEATVELVARASCWREMIKGLRDQVSVDRLVMVLRDMAAVPVRDSLENLEKNLIFTEENAMGSIKELDREYDAACGLLKQFSVDTGKLVEEYFREDIDAILAKDYYDRVILEAIEPAMAEAARKIQQENSLWGNIRYAAGAAAEWGKVMVNKTAGKQVLTVNTVESMEQRCSRIIRTSYEKQMTLLGTKWSQDLKDSPGYQLIARSVDTVQREMRRLWNKYKMDENRLLTDVKAVPVTFTGDFAQDILSTKQIYQDMKNVANFNLSPTFQSLLAAGGAFAGAAWIYVYLLPLDVIIPGIGTLLRILAGVVFGIVSVLAGIKSDERINKLRAELSDKLKVAIVDDRDKILEKVRKGDETCDPPKPGLNSIRRFYMDAFRTLLANQEASVRDNYASALEVLGTSQEERNQIAAAARTCRVEKIEPLRKKVEALIRKIDEMMK